MTPEIILRRSGDLRWQTHDFAPPSYGELAFFGHIATGRDRSYVVY